jgi:hypothetical protein
LWHLSLFCWDHELGIHFLHFPLNLALNFFLRSVVSILSSSHCSSWCCITTFLIG